ncbi:hypothetical protein GGR42_000150 [Saonia flava]|uniref:Membrane protein YfhO n=1 Tax=Saonia flava TaxID=523696 RepID=A0A846QNI4_9FLAO|nr:YfhO family protein [Saonia flava]NJB69688.1 hypothetical protein [Saonia flava]
MKPGFKALFTHFFVVVFFIVAALAYFHPVLQGKVILQSDIVQYNGMAKEQTDFKNKTGEEPYWTNSAFGGMPTYQLGANYPHNYVKKLDRLIRFLPRPADYLFLYLISFYILLCCLKVDFRLAILGALAFGFSTYLIIIIGVGHNAKAHALGYLPMVLAGILLVFQKRYLWGFVLTSIAMALEVVANHYQMTYYFMLLVLILGTVYFIYAIKNKEYKHFFISVGILLGAVVLGIGANATSLLATKEYADWSTRGKTELTINPDGSPKENTEGLSREYITQYSYGITESLDLFVPRLFGGSNQEDLGTKSKAYDYLTSQGLSRAKALEFSSGLPLYWGDQPGVSAPAYIGAIIFFLFIMGLFLVKGKSKWWLLAGTVMSLILSWGKNFSLLTDFMIDYFPLYDKFRAVSSIQIVLELCVPILAVLALVKLFKQEIPKANKVSALKISFVIMAGLGIALLLLKGMFDFSGINDETYRGYFGDELMTMIQRDREAVYVSDTIRSLIYVILAAFVIWLFIKEKINKNIAIIGVGLLIVIDLIGVDLRYVDGEDFVRKRRMTEPFQITAVDQQIQSDTSNYRVFDPSEGFQARTAYFHKSISGYHAARPRGMEDLFDFYLYRNKIGVLNMLNVKYVIQQDEEGRSRAAFNPDANGNAWFVKKLKEVKSANEEVLALDGLDTANEALINTNAFPDIRRFDFKVDSTSSIELIKYEPNHLIYKSTNPYVGIAVFSEMYYANGWNAYVNGNLKPHFKINHVLRALRLPEGEHTIEFKFEPKVVETGSKITLASCILLGLGVLGGIGFSFWHPRKKEEE